MTIKVAKKVLDIESKAIQNLKERINGDFILLRT